MMIVVNLFFNGVFSGEKMCTDGNTPYNYKASNKRSMFPLRIKIITAKKDSMLWKQYMQTRKIAEQ